MKPTDKAIAEAVKTDTTIDWLQVDSATTSAIEITVFFKNDQESSVKITCDVELTEDGVEPTNKPTLSDYAIDCGYKDAPVPADIDADALFTAVLEFDCENDNDIQNAVSNACDEYHNDMVTETAISNYEWSAM